MTEYGVPPTPRTRDVLTIVGIILALSIIVALLTQL